MTEFNENPFLKDTPVRCFSNGTEAEIWQHNNCDKCIRYENESKTQEEAKCKLAFFLALGHIVGTVPLWVAKEIGCKYDPLYLCCEFSTECRQKMTSESDLPW
jgi:hypothetical protein